MPERPNSLKYKLKVCNVYCYLLASLSTVVSTCKSPICSAYPFALYKKLISLCKEYEY